MGSAFPARNSHGNGVDAAPAPGEVLPESIHAAHERSARFGLAPQLRPEFDRAQRADFDVALEKSRLVRQRALPLMESLLDSIVDSSSMVLLTDAAGTILHALGNGNFMERARDVALAPGVCWSESARGTNAIGTAIVDSKPTVVHADQHYLTANHFLTCSACPILDPRGEVAGVLDVTGDWRGFHGHTLALVRMTARMIENQLIGDYFPDAVRVHFNSAQRDPGRHVEGIAVFDQGGRFVAANASAMKQLDLGQAELRTHTFSSLFHLPLSSIIEHQRLGGRGMIAARTFSGSEVHLRIEQRVVPRWITPGFAPEPPVAAQAAAVAQAFAAAPDKCATEGTSGHLVGRSARLSSLHYLNTGDPQMQSVIEKVKRVAGRDIPVMIVGETGTGKELLARAIHADSQRARKPFVAVNCASLPEALIESELFGYEEGAFTGARRRGQAGKIVSADGGTLFLDEIGDMPLALQARLLRVLQERVVTPLGGTRAVPVDVALVCATHRNLRERVASGEFREDLYYRLNGLTVKLPPLRDRSDLTRILSKIVASERQAPCRIDDEVLALFHRYRWPGNFRQLTNVLRAALAACDEAPVLSGEHLPDDFLDEVDCAPPAAVAALQPAAQPVAHSAAHSAAAHYAAISAAQSAAMACAAASPAAPAAAAERLQPCLSMAEIESASIERALREHRGNVSAAARALGISRNTIYRRMPAPARAT